MWQISFEWSCKVHSYWQTFNKGVVWTPLEELVRFVFSRLASKHVPDYFTGYCHLKHEIDKSILFRSSASSDQLTECG